MTDSIKPSDLVMFVRPRPCCGVASAMGFVGIAKAPSPHIIGFRCNDCGVVDHNTANYFDVGKGCAHVSRLKKIDPPALDESVERVRELENA